LAYTSKNAENITFFRAKREKLGVIKWFFNQKNSRSASTSLSRRDNITVLARQHYCLAKTVMQSNLDDIVVLPRQ